MNQQAIPEMIDWCKRTGYEVGVNMEKQLAVNTG